MAETRNFRSSYLGKVGIKGVEEKKSLEILLREQILDKNKLVQFVMRFQMPGVYRQFVWKILLDILPQHQGSHLFVLQQRKEQYENLSGALVKIGRIDRQTPQDELHLQMYLLQEGQLPFDQQKMLEEETNKVFMKIFNAMSEIESNPVDVFWLTARFYGLQYRYNEGIIHMQSKVEYYLTKEDIDGKLCNHLTKLNVFNHMPTEQWFQSGFAGVLPEGCIERVWDKLIGGSVKILVFVAVSILITFRRPLLSMNTIDEILKYLSQIPKDSGDHVVSKAIEIWQKHGSLLNPVFKSESPNTTERAPS